MQITAACTKCGKESEINIPDDHQGIQVHWECPGTVPEGVNQDGESYDIPCGTKNTIDGISPTQMALTRAGFGQVEPGVVAVHDGDSSGEIKDTQVISPADMGSASGVIG